MGGFSESKRKLLKRLLESKIPTGQSPQGPRLQPVARDGEMPLSFAQQRLWFLDQLEPGGFAYNVPAAVVVEGRFQAAAWEQAVREIVRRHEALRTTFSTVGDRPRQVIGGAGAFSLQTVDLRQLPAAERRLNSQRLAAVEAERPFDLSQGPLIRALLVRLDDERHLVLLTLHHVVCDGWSLAVMVNELSTFYGAFSKGGASPLPELAIQYPDFSAWQREWLAGTVLETQLSYWKDRLAGAPPSLLLPMDRPRPAVQSARGATQPVVLSESLSAQLKALSQREGTTLFCTLLAAFQALLYRWTGQRDILVGTPVAGRRRAELERMIGLFVNTLVLRSDLRNDPSFDELLAQVHEVALEAWANQDVPFEKLVDELGGQRDLSRTPLFQVMFILQNTPTEPLTLPELAVTPFEVGNPSAKFDMLLDMSETGQGLTGTLQYNTDLFDGATVSRFLVHFETLLKGVASDPKQRISSLPLLSGPERQQLLVEWNDTRADFPQGVCIHHLFEAQVEKTPDAVALVAGRWQLTYRELSARANQLAHHLRSAGVGPDVRVGICMDRSVEMAVGLLGTLKAGGAYVPIDPSYPKERLARILHDADPLLVLTSQSLLRSLPDTSACLLCLDSEWDVVARDAYVGPTSETTTAQNLAYVLYTSGSTGNPKGVMISHGALCNHMLWMQAEFSLSESDRVLQKTPFGFDASLVEFWPPWLAGAALVMAEPGKQYDSGYLVDTICGEQVTVVEFVPSLFRMVLEEPGLEKCRCLSHIILGGEVFTASIFEKYSATSLSAEIHNFYGPTETTIDATFWRYQPEVRQATVPIGVPIDNLQAYLLDAGGQPVPIGVLGELHIGGAGLGRGYLHRPDLTALKFVPNPFSSDPSGTRLYNAGDFCRYLPDGNIEFLGRRDDQVKVRGYRIELGDIEAAINQHPAVREVVVVTRADAAGEPQLLAYLSPTPGSSPQASQLRGWLKQQLPVYMVPATFVLLETLPKTPNGKVDRRALPAPSPTRAELDDDFVAPRTLHEHAFADIWSEVLSIDRIGVHDNFFDLGGHSLSATQVVTRIRNAYNVEFPLRNVFETPTVAGLASSLEQALKVSRKSDVPAIERIRHDERRPLSFAQQRLWFLDQMSPGNPYYNMAAALELRGELHVHALERAIGEIVRRHEVLQATYVFDAGQPRQVRTPLGGLMLPVVDLSALARESSEEHVRALAAADALRPFDLATGPVLRATLVKQADDVQVLLFAMHHIVSDGWSLSVVVRELSTLYQAFCDGRPSPMAELPVQYVDFAHWQRQWLQGDVLRSQLAYWKGRLAGQLPTTSFRADRPRPEVESFRGADEVHLIPQDLTRQLNRLSARENVTLFMTLVAAYKALLYQNVGQDDIVVGTDLAGRSQPELEGLIGFFVNLLVLRSDLSGNPTFRGLLARVRETAMGAFAHQDVPFDRLVEELQPARHRSRTPLFQMLFVMENVPAENLRLPGLTMTFMPSQADTARFDLALFVREQDDGLVTKWIYKIDLFDRSTIHRLANQYHALLEHIAAAPDTRVNDLELRTPEEIRLQALEEDRQRDLRMSTLVPGRRRARTLPE